MVLNQLSNYEAWNNSGTFYNHVDQIPGQNKFEEAAACFKKAITLKSDYDIALVNLGLIYGKKELFEDAKEYFRKAMKIDGDYAQTARDAIDKIEAGQFQEFLDAFK